MQYLQPAGERPALTPLLNNLLGLVGKLQQSAAPELKTLQQQVRALLQQPPNIRDIKQPNALKQALLDSGSHLETKLTYLRSQLTGQSNTASANTLRSETLVNALKRQPQLQRNGAQIVNTDLKAQLLQFAQTLTAATPSNSPTGAKPVLLQLLNLFGTAQATANPAAQQTTQPPGNQPFTAQAIAALARQLSGQPAASDNDADSNQLQQLQRQLFATLAKIQVNQLQSIAPQPTTADTPSQQSWVFDLPIYMGQSYRTVHLELDQEQPTPGSEESSKAGVWKVTLGFDLEGMGEFFATLRIADESVSTTFWSERPQTLSRINTELGLLKSSLQKLGLQVDELNCRAGTPPTRKTLLDHQLVDIRT